MIILKFRISIRLLWRWCQLQSKQKKKINILIRVINIWVGKYEQKSWNRIVTVSAGGTHKGNGKE